MPSWIALPWGTGLFEMNNLVGVDMSQSAGDHNPIVSGRLAMGICTAWYSALARLFTVQTRIC